MHGLYHCQVTFYVKLLKASCRMIGCEWADSFIYVYLQDAVLNFLSRDSFFSWYFFCFYQQETSFVLAREHKKVLLFVQSAICHSFHQSYVSALSTWSATNTVLFSRKDPLSFREILNRFSVFLLFFLFFVWIQPQYFIRSGWIVGTHQGDFHNRYLPIHMLQGKLIWLFFNFI